MTGIDALKEKYRERCIERINHIRGGEVEGFPLDVVDAVLEVIAADMGELTGVFRETWILKVEVPA